MKAIENSFYHVVWAIVVTVLGLDVLRALSQHGDAALSTLAAIIGHIAWPIVVLILGFSALRAVNGDLLSKLFPHGGRVKMPGVEIERLAEAKAANEAATAAVDAAGIEKHAPEPAEAPAVEPQQVVADVSPYETVMNAWRDVSFLIAKLAAKHGGRADARYLYENVELLRYRGILPGEVADLARALFKARNSFRRLPADALTEDEAYEFVANAGSLAGYLKLIN